MIDVLVGRHRIFGDWGGGTQIKIMRYVPVARYYLGIVQVHMYPDMPDTVP